MKNFKILAIFASLIAILSGCAPTQSVLTLDAYAPSALKPATNKQIFISKVEDSRKNKSVVATITNSKGGVSEYVVLQNDLSEWFRQALTTELRAQGAMLGGEDSALAAEIYISEFSANMSGYEKDNTKGDIRVVLKVKRGDETITKTISNEQTKFALIRTGGAFKPFLKEILDDIIKRTAAQILSL